MTGKTMEFIIGLIIFVLDIWAIYKVVTSGATTLAKVGWTLAIVILPVIGLIIWYFAGPKGPSTHSV
jgi:hypothetical protein